MKIFLPSCRKLCSFFSLNFDLLILATITCWVSKDHMKSHLSQDLLCAGACRAGICIPRWRTGNISQLHSLHQWYTPGGKDKSVICQNSCLSLPLLSCLEWGMNPKSIPHSKRHELWIIRSIINEEALHWLYFLFGSKDKKLAGVLCTATVG